MATFFIVFRVNGMSAWFVYILDCDGKAYYTGVAMDPHKRCAEHASGSPRGAKFTRRFIHIDLVYKVRAENKRQAMRIEYALKKRSRQTKKMIIDRAPDLSRLLELLGLDDMQDSPSAFC